MTKRTHTYDLGGLAARRRAAIASPELTLERAERGFVKALKGTPCTIIHPIAENDWFCSVTTSSATGRSV